jgi:hypothetical protein
VDQYIALGWSTKRVPPLESLMAIASVHTFHAERGSLSYGTEADLQLEVKFKRVKAMLKYAGYDATHFATDTTKYWAQVEFVL